MAIAFPGAEYKTLTPYEYVKYLLQPNDILNDIVYKETPMRTDSADPKEIASVKETKDRPSYSILPIRALRGVMHAFRSGAEKYGRLNWRDNGDIKASIYFDAAMDHMASWWEGEDCTSDSRLNHLDHAIAGLLILRDAELQDGVCDDRPLPLPKAEIYDGGYYYKGHYDGYDYDWYYYDGIDPYTKQWSHRYRHHHICPEMPIGPSNDMTITKTA